MSKKKYKAPVDETPVLISEEIISENLISDELLSMEELSLDRDLDEENLSEALFSEDSEELAVSELDIQTDGPSFLPEVEASEQELFLDTPTEEIIENQKMIEGSELDQFESAEIEEVEFVEQERLISIVESILFASDRPVSLASIKEVFKGTNIKTDKIKKAIDQLAVEYASASRGVTLEEVTGGFQLRTKIDNLEFLKRGLKTRQFRVSGPALEVLAIVAYKQPLIKSEIDEIRGVESGHLLRALMEKGLVAFEGKSDLPGKPMQYGTTRKFLEIFGLRNLKELPTLSQIDELLPEGIDEQEAVAKPTLSTITDSMSETISVSYSTGEEELTKITDQLESISTSSDFFEQEKLRQKMKRDEEKAQNLREALALGEEVSNRDKNWLKKYDEALAQGLNAQTVTAPNEGESALASEAEGSVEVETMTSMQNELGAESDAEGESHQDLQADDSEGDDLDPDENHHDDLFLNDVIEDDEQEH
jgi:segregation and condensation protein B